jgi:hypothetical protein
MTDPSKNILSANGSTVKKRLAAEVAYGKLYATSLLPPCPNRAGGPLKPAFALSGGWPIQALLWLERGFSLLGGAAL